MTDKPVSRFPTREVFLGEAGDLIIALVHRPGKVAASYTIPLNGKAARIVLHRGTPFPNSSKDADPGKCDIFPDGCYLSLDGYDETLNTTTLKDLGRDKAFAQLSPYLIRVRDYPLRRNSAQIREAMIDALQGRMNAELDHPDFEHPVINRQAAAMLLDAGFQHDDITTWSVDIDLNPDGSVPEAVPF